MGLPFKIRSYPVPDGVATSDQFSVEVRSVETSSSWHSWAPLSAFTTDVADVNITRDEFNRHAISIISLEARGAIEIKAVFSGLVEKARIRPESLCIAAQIEDAHTITFTLNRAVDVMLEINSDKWQALHVLVNEIDDDAPTADSDNVWYFGPGLNNGTAYSKIVGGNLLVPSNHTVYLAGGAFLHAKLNFIGISNASVRGPGFIYKGPNAGAILIERSRNIVVEQVTSIGATGFSLTTGEAHGVRITGYRSFSSHANGDGVDFFCSSDILLERCFLRNSDDTIAIYGHRWDYFGDTKNITIRDCVLLPDIAHPIHMGTHGAPAEPEIFSNIRISNIDILDHYENQMWYQGCISINAGDENLIEDVIVDNIRIEKISKGQLINIRVMQNQMWTTAPGRGVRNVTLKNIELKTDENGIVNPSQILGFDDTRRAENITFENLKIGGRLLHDNMGKPRWYMVSDFVPMFVNEHARNVKFIVTQEEEREEHGIGGQ